MGQRSYLYFKNPNKKLFVFEANNSLPFFWLSLLDRETLKTKIEDWKKNKLEEIHTEEEDNVQYLELYSNGITIDEQTFRTNSTNSRFFLQKHFLEAIPLFDDFIKFIKIKFESYNNLEIDITQFSAFYNSDDDFYEALDNELKSIENDSPEKLQFLMVDDLIANGTGFEIVENKEFSTFPTYQEALKNRATPTFKSEKKFSKKSLITFIFLLLLCPIFSLLTYKMFKDDGPTLPIILIGLLNIGFYIFCIWEIFAEIKAYKKQSI